MLTPKTGKPIAFKCTEEFRQQTEAIADSMGKSLSDYVRLAVETYNAEHQQNKAMTSSEAEEILKQIRGTTDTMTGKATIKSSKDKEFKTFFKK